jgi:hypothetical protein
MSKPRISLSPDLQRLRDEGFNIEIRATYLLLKDVPYVTASRQVKCGTLVSTLTMGGDVTVAPDTHVAMFVGEYPCDSNGAELEAIKSSGPQQLAPDLYIDFQFSSKPYDGAPYSDYYHKMTSYVAILESHAQALDPSITARTFPVIPTDEDDGTVFNYMDTAAGRALINMANKKLELPNVAIVGLGGTGSYVLDLVAKTPVLEIHLFDGDTFLSHNAFRAPGAASIGELNAKPHKVIYLGEQYSKMRKGIVNHPYNIDASNAAEMQGMDFVFLCVDAGAAKRAIVAKLEELSIAFLDVGMGIDVVDDSLGGILRVTTSVPGRRDLLRQRVSLADAQPGDDDYDRNIQIADLNALNAAMAVIKWKKLCGFYRDYGQELNSTYTIDSNMLLSEEANEA